jgi:hypothetical protein
VVVPPGQLKADHFLVEPPHGVDVVDPQDDLGESFDRSSPGPHVRQPPAAPSIGQDVG